MTVGRIIDIVISMMIYLIIARSILSFFPHNPYQSVWRFIYDVTDPLLKPFRRISLRTGGFGIDFSPFLAIFILLIIKWILQRLVI